MAIKIVRLGSKRAKREGLRIGAVRYPPHGVPKDELASQDYYDVWFPNLSPTAALLKEVKEIFAASDEKGWLRFKKKFLAEMKVRAPRQDLELLAALSHQTNMSLGCYCEHESRCHRSILRDLLVQLGADVT